MQTRQASQQSKETHAVFQTQRLTNPSTVKPVRRSLHPTVLIQRATAAPGALNRMEVLQLQRTIGNRATGRLVKGRRQNEREEGNTTGLPDHLKTGIETLSGVSLDDVKVHYNSSLPASYEAHAFAKGRDIHVGPGKENSLPHEAWHIVQQRQGRVRANVEMNHHLINADASLEREADKMGWEAAEVNIPDRADSFAKSTISAPILRNDAVMQMDWYEKVGANIILRAGKKPGGYRLVKGLKASDGKSSVYEKAEQRAEVRRQQEELQRQEELRRQAELQRQAELRRQEELRRQAELQQQNLFQKHGPKRQQNKQMNFPKVGYQEGEDILEDNSLLYRGMSVNNIRNLKKKKEVIFNAQNPVGKAGPVAHIVNDDENSPYLSFEAEGLAISAGKYAPKPVNPKTHKPYGVTKKEGGFLKQEKSYTKESRRKYADAKRIGYVGGINPSGKEQLDYSTPEKARVLDSEKARTLAIADKEVLVKPGAEGIKKDKVPFVAKVKQVSEAYYRKNLGNQSATKAVGYYKPSKGDPNFYKLQIGSAYTEDRYAFDIPSELQRRDDATDPEMSDVESIEFSDEEEGIL